MTRFLASLSIAALLAAAAQAQCLPAPSGSVQTLTPIGGFSADDEGSTVPAVALGMTFPMAGALPFAPGATHAFIYSNGELYLTNSTYGIFAPVSPATYGISYVDEMRGNVANASPRIAPFSGDQEAGNGGVWGIYLDTSVAGQATIQWKDMWSYTGGFPTGSYSFSCTLYNSGIVDFSYDAAGNYDTGYEFVGVSIGNNVGTSTSPGSDLSAGADSGTLGLLFEQFSGVVPDLAGRTLRISPNGTGGFTSSVICTAAYNQNYGTGCYDFSAAGPQVIYQTFGAGLAGGLAGNSMVATPTGNGYTFTWGGGTYLAPSGGATTILPVDDNEVDVVPSLPFPHVSGPVATLSVCSNGFVNMGPIGNNNIFSYGSVYDLLNGTVASFRNNADYDARPAASPTGAIKYEEVAGILYVTWENVERYNGGTSTGLSDRQQIQLNLATGSVTYVWDNMQGIGFGGQLVVGYSAAGTSVDPGQTTLASGLPVTTQPDINMQALSLSASPAPVITAGGAGPSVPITWTVSNVPDLAPPFGIGLTLAMFSLAPLSPGLDMGFLGMPGCNLNILSLDVIIGFPGLAPVDNLTLVVPQPLAPGLSFYCQALSLFNPNSLPNGQNPFGGLLSNGVQSFFNVF